MRKKCAFLTLEEVLDYVIDDELAVAPLEALGWKVETLPWRQTDVPWSDFDVVIIRSTWDYQKAPEEFCRALEQIEAATRLENPLRVVKWNLSKAYLRELEREGVAIVPTRWGRGLRSDQWPELCDGLAAEELVIKPLISASAGDTFRLPRDVSADRLAEIEAVFRDRDFLIQPMLQSIVDEGEYSLFFFGGEYSHCVLKTPESGDFRVQEEHGGAICGVVPDADLQEQAQAALAVVCEIHGLSSLLYARVDWARLATGEFGLMELELIEPSLYFRFDEAAPRRFAQAIDAVLR